MPIEAANQVQAVMARDFSIREPGFRPTAELQSSDLVEDFRQSDLLEDFRHTALLDYVLKPATSARGFDNRYFMQLPHHGVKPESLRTLFERRDESDWNDAKNDRRCELIDKEIDGTLLHAEKRELEKLQSQMLAYRRKVAPLPLKEAQRLHQQLLKKAAEQVD